MNINGFFDPTGEKSLDGRVLYTKRFYSAVVIEHFAGKWQVKGVSDKGKNMRVAEVPGCCPFEVCKSEVWQVGNGGALEEQPSVKMVTGAEAEAQASSCLSVAIFSMPSPPLHTRQAYHCSTSWRFLPLSSSLSSMFCL
jgi:hypothetical protein